MTVLSAQTIRMLCLQSKLVEPFVDRTVHNLHNLSYGLSGASYDVRIDQDLLLNKGDFCLASTMEHVNIPLDVMCIVHDKSSLIRRGIAVQNSLLDPGFKGHVTLEISHHGPEYFQFHKGMPVAQLVFHKLDHPTEQGYNGKYQNQPRGPQESK